MLPLLAAECGMAAGVVAEHFGEPVASEDPASLVAVLTETERRVRDPQRPPEALVEPGRWQ